MRRVNIFTFLFLLACAPRLEAQGGFTTVTGTITDPNGLKYSCGTITAQLITAGGAAPTLNGGGFTTQTSPIGLGCPTTPGTGAPGSFLMRLADSGVIVPSTTTWRFTINLAPGIPPPAGTGPQSFSVTTAINCGTNTPATCTSNAMDISTLLSASAPAISNSSAGNANQVNFGPSGVDLRNPAFGGQSRIQAETTGANFTVTSGSNIVTTTSLHFLTSTYHVCAVGDIMWSTTWNGLDGNYPSSIVSLGNPGGTPTRITVTSCDSDTQVHVSSNANANAGTTNGNTGTLWYGPDDDNGASSPWMRAETAISQGIVCGTLFVPSGITNWSQAHFNNQAFITCRGKEGGNSTSKYIVINGTTDGGGSTIAVTPWFSTTTGGPSGAGCNGGSGAACSGVYGQYNNLSWNGGGSAGNITLGSHNFFENIFTDDSYSNLAFWGMPNMASNAYVFVLSGGYHIAQNIIVDGGGTCFGIQNNNHLPISGWFGGNCNNVATLTMIGGGGVLADNGGAYTMGASGAMVNVGAGRYVGYDVLLSGSPNVSSVCFIASTGFIYLIDPQCTNNGNTTSAAIQVTGAGYGYASGGILVGGATGNAWGCNAAATCVAGEGNNYGANPIGTIGCNSSTSPSVCGANPRGTVALAAGVTTLTVNTSAVTANSIISVTNDDSLGGRLGVTCNTTINTIWVSARTPGTSFQITVSAAPVTNPECISYTILN